MESVLVCYWLETHRNRGRGQTRRSGAFGNERSGEVFFFFSRATGINVLLGIMQKLQDAAANTETPQNQNFFFSLFASCNCERSNLHAQ